MRMMYKFLIPNEKGNQAKADGSLRKAIDEIIERTKPECAYFYMYQGRRGGLMVFDIQHPSELIPLNDLLMSATGAEINVHPAMTREDLDRAP